MLSSLRPHNRLLPASLLEMERDLSDWFSGALAPRADDWFGGEMFPRVNVSQDDSTIDVSLELPGMKPDDFQIEILQGDLMISGEKRVEEEDEKEENGRTWHSRERRFGSFRRMIPLPAVVDDAKVKAVYKDGVLRVHLAKAPEATSKKIPVKT